MRRIRWLLPLAAIAITVWVVDTYVQRKETLAKDAPAPPPPLESGVEGRANNWCYTQTDGNVPKVKICAEKFRQVKEPSVMELDGVELNIYHQDGSKFDLVKSAQAQFDMNGKTLFSEGVVDITKGVPADGPTSGRLVHIHTSGVTFASDTGRATTSRAATFEFDRGGGSAVGVEYDPQARELRLGSQVKLDWTSKDPEAKPMHIEAGAAIYKERESVINLGPWSKLTRDALHLDAGASVVYLEDGTIRRADVQMANGSQQEPGRKIDFAAEQLTMNFGDSNVVTSIHGEHNGRVVSTSATARTTMTADKLDLDFVPSGHESLLSNAVATGKSVAQSDPIPGPGVDPTDTRTLRSEVIRLKMRPGGKEIDNVETDGPGTLDFIPNRAGQPKRFLKGDRIWIAYAGENKIQSFRSVNVSTRTEKPAPQGKPAPPPAVTQSKEIAATFDPVSGDLARIEQKTDFRYDEGDQHARGDRAVLEQQTSVMTLDGQARVWDPTGATSADRIVMNQKTGEYNADGRVASTHQPDKAQPGKGTRSSGMLSGDEVLEARAQRMVSTEHNQKIHYEGNAVAWQGANRVEADRLDIDRGKQVLEAHGKVKSQFADKAKDGTAKTAAPVFTVVHAPDLIYSDETRLAYYKGGVSMVRPDLTVNSRELRAYLKDSSSDSSLDKAFADGTVKIVSIVAGKAPKRTRTGTSEHAEYFPDDQKVILVDGQPLLVDSSTGKTTGKELTWFANNDRLLVNGVESKPAESTIRKK